MIKTLLIFLAAVVDTAILTSLVSTQLVLADLSGFGLTVTFSDRLQATLHDLLGLAAPLLILIGLSFLVAFTVARYAIRFGGSTRLWYLAAGFFSIPAAIILIKYFMGGTLLASARTPLGMLLVAFCGMAGGWIYSYLKDRFGDKVSANA